MREIVLDTETTGFEPADGHRLVEIGCIELFNYVPTGKTFHKYINPERDVPAEAAAIHGLTTDRLKKEPVFSQIYIDLMEFLGDAPLVIHNAAFDMKFLNAELKTVGHPQLPHTRAKDTLLIARKKYPGSPASLDALCRRFAIDLSERDFHGALLDSQLLAEVYLEMMGGRQHGFGLATSSASNETAATHVSVKAARERIHREPRAHAPTAEELALHEALLGKLKDPIWKDEAA
jgi:DNA polymerase-3 subunit epsilon